MVVVCLAWAAFYLVLQGQDGVLARTVDRVDALLLRATFLNVPLQLALTVVACFGLGRRAPPTATRIGLVLGGLNLLLIAGHVLVTVLTA